MFFEILVKRTQSVTPPAPELFLLLGELPEGRQGGLKLHRCLVEGGEEEKVLLWAGCPCLPLCQTHCQAAAELGKTSRDSDTHSLGEIILSLKEFKLPETEAEQVSTHRGAGQCSRCFSLKTTSSFIQELHTVTSSSL